MFWAEAAIFVYIFRNIQSNGVTAREPGSILRDKISSLETDTFSKKTLLENFWCYRYSLRRQNNAACIDNIEFSRGVFLGNISVSRDEILSRTMLPGSRAITLFDWMFLKNVNKYGCLGSKLKRNKNIISMIIRNLFLYTIRKDVIEIDYSSFCLFSQNQWRLYRCFSCLNLAPCLFSKKVLEKCCFEPETDTVFEKSNLPRRLSREVQNNAANVTFRKQFHRKQNKGVYYWLK